MTMMNYRICYTQPFVLLLTRLLMWHNIFTWLRILAYLEVFKAIPFKIWLITLFIDFAYERIYSAIQWAKKSIKLFLGGGGGWCKVHQSETVHSSECERLHMSVATGIVTMPDGSTPIFSTHGLVLWIWHSLQTLYL